MADDYKAVSDEDLVKDERQRTHNRKHKVLDAMTQVAVAAIYLVPTMLMILYLAVLCHEALDGQWDKLETTLQGMVVPVITYLAGVLSNNGVLPKNGKS